MRAETIESLSPMQLRTWREQITHEVHGLADSLPTEKPVDLMDDYARPLCLSLGAMATGISREDGARLYEKARRVSAAAAEPYDVALRLAAKAANAELRSYFHSGPRAYVARGSLLSRKPYLVCWETPGSL